MVEVKRIDTPAPKKTRIYWSALLLSWIPLLGLTLSLNGLIRSIVKIVTSRKSRKTDKRAIVGLLFSSVALIVSVAATNMALNPTPSITLDTAKGTISTDEDSYTLTGKITKSENGKLTINDKDVPIVDEKFSHVVALQEGDNTFTIIATNENGSSKKTVKIHRTTKAELQARADAEKVKQEKLAQEQAEKEHLEAEQKAQHTAHINDLATKYCTNHQGNRNIYTPSDTSKDVWDNPNKDLVTKYPQQANCVTIMTFFVDTMPSDYIDNIVNAKVGTGMNKAEVLAAWGWPNNNSNHTSSWGSSGTWMWNTGTCYYGVCSGAQYATFHDGKVTSTGSY